MIIEPLETRIAPASLIFANGIGAAGTQSVSDIGTDPAGNIYVTGTFKGAVDFDPGPGAEFRTAAAGHTDAFIAKYTGIGALAWVNVLRSSDGEAVPPELAVSPGGEVFLTARYGDTPSSDLRFFEGDGISPTHTLFQPGNTTNVYVAKADTTGRFVWASAFGGTGASVDASDIATGPGGVVYIGGTFGNGASSGTLNLGGFGLTSDGEEVDMFVMQLQDSAVQTVNWAFDTNSTGSANIMGPELAVDGGGLLVAAGIFSGQFDITGLAVTATALDAGDFFIARFDPAGAGASLLVTISGGGTGTENPGRDQLGVLADGQGDITLGGQFSGTTDFDPGAGLTTLSSAGKNDLFFVQLDADGTFLSVEKYGGKDDEAFLALARTGPRYMLAGTFEGPIDLPGIDSGIPIASTGPDDAMLLTLNGGGNVLGVHRLDMENGPAGAGLLTDFLSGGGFALDGRPDGSLSYASTFRGTLDVGLGPGVKNAVSKGGADFFVARLFPDGLSEQPLFQPVFDLGFALGATGDQGGQQVVVDAAGNIYLAGIFQGTVDFNLSPEVENLTSSDRDGNYFVAKYDPSGSLIWVERVATILPEDDANLALALDAASNVYLAGEYETSATVGGFTLTNADAELKRDVFVASFDTNGVPRWAVTIGGAGGDEFVDTFAVKPDTGAVALAGTFSSAMDFDPGDGSAPRTPIGSPGTTNSYVLAFDTDGNFQWVRHIAGIAGSANPGAIGFLSAGDVVLAGNFNGTVNLDTGGITSEITAGPGFGDDIFVAKFEGVSGMVGLTRVLGSTDSDEVGALLVTAGDQIILGGEFTGTLVIDSAPPLIETGGGREGDAFIIALDASLGHAASIGFGGAEGDHVAFLGLDGNGALVAGGKFAASVDFDPGPGVARLTSTTDNNIFVARYDLRDLAFLSAFRIEAFDSEEENLSGLDTGAGGGLAMDAAGNVFLTGAFKGAFDADVSGGTRTFKSKGGYDLIFAKFSPANLADATHIRTFRDANGDEVTLKLTGPGSLVYTLAGGVSDFADAELIELTDTTLATTFTITVKQSGDGTGETVIGTIRTTGALQHIGSIFLPDTAVLGAGTADLIPDLLITGASRTLRLGDLVTNTFIKLGQDLPYNVPNETKTPDTYNHRPDLSINNVTGDGVVIEVTGDGNVGGIGGGGLGKVVIGSWMQTGFIRTTQSIGSLTVLNGNFLATVEVDATNVGMGTTASMGSVTIQNGAWGSSGSEIEGGIGAFDADAFLAGASITAGSIGTVKITNGSFAGTLILTDPVSKGTKAFTVATDFTGNVVASAPLKSIKVKGDFMGSLRSPTIGAISAHSFLGTTSGNMEGDPLRHNITTTAGPLGILTSTVGTITDYELTSTGGFGGIAVKLGKLTASTSGLDRVGIQAASIGKITVSLTAAKIAPGIELIGIRDSQFVTTGTAPTGALRGSIGAIAVSLTGTAGGGDAAGIRNTIFDARVDDAEFGPDASTVNTLASVKVTVKNQDGSSIGIEGGSFLGNSIGATTVAVTRGKAPAATATAVNGASLTASGGIGAMLFDGDATAAQVTGLSVFAGAGVGAVTVKAKTLALGTLDNSVILAGQSLDLSGTTVAAIKSALAKANLGSVKTSGSFSKVLLAAGGSIGAVTIGGDITDSLILAGAKLGGDYAIDGDETYQRAAAIAAVTVGGAVSAISIIAGVDPMNGIFGDAGDITAPAAGPLTQASLIGPVTFSALGSAPAPALLDHTSAIQAAVIKSVKTAAGVFSDFTIAQFLDNGPIGEDAGDILVRVR